MGGRRAGLVAKLGIGAALALAAAAAGVAVLRTDVTGRRGSGLGRAFEYDLAEFRRVEPGLVGYTETARIATGFSEARSVAVDAQDKILVAGDRAVRVFSPDGARLAEFPVEGEPRCLAAGAGGTLYVGMRDHVEVYALDGPRKAVWEPAGEKAHLTSLALDESGTGALFAADAGSRIVLVYELSGRLAGRIGAKDDSRGVPGLVVPSACLDIAISREGTLFVTNPGRHRIETYTREGEILAAWGEPGMDIKRFSGCCNPSHFALLPEGSFVTSEKGALRRIKVYRSDGSFECVVAGPEDFGEGTAPMDVAADSRGRVLVLDPDRREVRVFERVTGKRSSP